MMLLLRLYFEFFKTGLFAVGGGLATLPFLSAMSDRFGWFTHQQLADMVAVAESTPGPIGVNVATYVGYSTAGIIGGIVSTLGLITPSIIIIIAISKVLTTFNDNRFVKTSFRFLRPTSIGLILAAGLSFALSSLFFKESGAYTLNIPSCILAAVLAALIFFFPKAQKVHPIFWIGISAVIGICFF